MSGIADENVRREKDLLMWMPKESDTHILQSNIKCDSCPSKTLSFGTKIFTTTHKIWS